MTNDLPCPSQYTNDIMRKNQNPQQVLGRLERQSEGAVLHLLPRECGRTDQCGRPDFIEPTIEYSNIDLRIHSCATVLEFHQLRR